MRTPSLHMSSVFPNFKTVKSVDSRKNQYVARITVCRDGATGFSPVISNKNENFNFFGNFNGIIAFKCWKTLPRLSDSKFSFSCSWWHFGFKNLLAAYVFQNRPAGQSFSKNANFSPRVISRIHDYETRVANFITLPVWRGGAPVSQLVSQEQWNQP